MIKCHCNNYIANRDVYAGKIAPDGINLNACSQCGYVPTPAEINEHFGVGLGDVISSALEKTGIKKVVEAVANVVGRDCGCDRRREALNEWSRGIKQ